MASLNERSKEVRMEKQRFRRKIGIIAGIIFAVIIAGVVAWYIKEAIRTKKYTGYEVIGSYERANNDTIYRYYDGDLLKYSHDGASGVGRDGTDLWNASYDFREPLLDVCGRYVVIADMGGKEVYVFNGSDSGVTMDVPYPIADVRISRQGVVAVVLEDERSNVIQLYNPYAASDKLLAEVPTNVSDDGYPVDIALSPDGQSLVTTYLGIENGGQQSNVCFYNFSAVGQDKNRMVGGSPYKDSLVAKLEFCGDNSVCVFLNNGFAIYSNMKQPVLVHEETFEEEIASVMCSDSYVGFVFNKAGETGTRNLRLYNLKGNKVLDRDISYEYDNISIYGQDIVIYNDLNCAVLRVDGSEKFQYSFDKGIDYFIKADGDSRYYLIDADNVNIIKLTEDK